MTQPRDIELLVQHYYENLNKVYGRRDVYPTPFYEVRLPIYEYFCRLQLDSTAVSGINSIRDGIRDAHVLLYYGQEAPLLRIFEFLARCYFPDIEVQFNANRRYEFPAESSINLEEHTASNIRYHGNIDDMSEVLLGQGLEFKSVQMAKIPEGLFKLHIEKMHGKKMFTLEHGIRGKEKEILTYARTVDEAIERSMRGYPSTGQT